MCEEGEAQEGKVYPRDTSPQDNIYVSKEGAELAGRGNIKHSGESEKEMF